MSRLLLKRPHSRPDVGRTVTVVSPCPVTSRSGAVCAGACRVRGCRGSAAAGSVSASGGRRTVRRSLSPDGLLRDAADRLPGQSEGTGRDGTGRHWKGSESRRNRGCADRSAQQGWATLETGRQVSGTGRITAGDRDEEDGTDTGNIGDGSTSQRGRAYHCSGQGREGWALGMHGKHWRRVDRLAG